MKAIAWAILDRGELAVFDGRCPIYWLRKVAKTEADERGLGPTDEHRLVRVEIREVPRRRPRTDTRA